APLVARASEPGVREVILALPATVDGQTTAHYLADRLGGADVAVTMLARGVPVGGELDWLDDGTIAQAMRARRPARSPGKAWGLVPGFSACATPAIERTMNLDASTIAAAACLIAAVLGFGWALMERRRAGLAEARAWDLGERAAHAEARVRALEEQQVAQAEILRAQAAKSASDAAEALVKRTEETFRSREQLAQARLEAQLKPVAETLTKFQEQVAAVEKTRAE